ncbi:MAG: phosphohistidine phosphatase SixA [Gemmatimonadota bacterium]
MQLLIIRHGIAEDKDVFARSGRGDNERPLTAEGQNQLQHVSKGLRRIAEHIDVFAASPLVRASQTAAIIAREYDGMNVETVPALEPQRAPEEFAGWLETRRAAEIVAAVGHEPHLGMLVTWLMSGVEDSHVELEKAGGCLLTIEGTPGPRCATLCWLLTPEMLER